MKRILAMTVLAAGCASPLPQTPPPGAAARVEAPEVRPGGSWSYAYHDGYTKISRGNVEYRVSAIQGDTITVEVQGAGGVSTERYARGWNWRERPMTNLQNFRYEPSYPALPFPLEAGKSWQAHVNAIDPVSGKVNRVRIDGKVLGWERVKVPAGEFDALKVQRLVYAGNADSFLSEEKISEIDWYAPRVGLIVKHVSTSGHLDTRIGCGERSCDQWVKGDWNVLELVTSR